MQNRLCFIWIFFATNALIITNILIHVNECIRGKNIQFVADHSINLCNSRNSRSKQIRPRLKSTTLRYAGP